MKIPLPQRSSQREETQKNDQRWIESLNCRHFKRATKFPPLPGGEGRGEGERKHTLPHREIFSTTNQSLLTSAPTSKRLTSSDLTLIELLVVIVIVVFFAMMLMPRNTGNKARSTRILCVNNQRQIGIAETVWAGDHGNKFSFQLAETNGGTMAFATGPNAWRHFQILSNELFLPKVLICPSDDFRTAAATNFNSLNNSNLSYFVGLDATLANPQGLLSGDWNITNGTSIKNGILELTTNRATAWTGGTHKKVGNLTLSDSSVQQVSIAGLRTVIENTAAVTNHLQMPVTIP